MDVMSVKNGSEVSGQCLVYVVWMNVWPHCMTQERFWCFTHRAFG